jgi:N-acetylglucosaminyldiphosphoundecaprenol N-acetyl-beta-D-mannosaminyltransferase
MRAVAPTRHARSEADPGDALPTGAGERGAVQGADLPRPTSTQVLGTRVDATSYPDALSRIARWARSQESRYVCVSTVNNVMVARRDPGFRRVMNDADLVTPDGMPLVWALRWLGLPDATRVRGTDLMISVLDGAARQEVPVGVYGGDPKALEAFVHRVRTRWPGLDVAYAYSPPFRTPSLEEEDKVVREITESGARILFVALGCPKQERWMARHRGRLSAVMVGVGAAIDFVAGTKKEAPRFLQDAGLEWLFRLATEPRRLWRRYLPQNPVFMALLALQVARHRLHRAALERDDMRRPAQHGPERE